MKQWMVVSMIGLLTFGMVGCATVPTDHSGETSSPLAALRAFTKADLAQASEIAMTHGDIIAAKCYDAISTHLDIIKEPSLPKIKGAFSLHETARVGVARFRGAIPPEIHVACAPIVVDAQRTLIRLGLIGSGLPIPGL